MNPQKVKNQRTLKTLLSYRRPGGSKTEKQFIAAYLDTISGMEKDGYGNRWLLHPTSRTLISCHTDTVHINDGRQAVYIQPKTRIASLHATERASNCLGADDTAGIFAALAMIRAGVPVSYVFHRDEETGGKGSRWAAANLPDRLKRFDRCIALDRRGTGDVITHQAWERCCSDTFAQALASALGGEYQPCPNGIFTDSANYTHLIPECTNLSVGYQHEHTKFEALDTIHLANLIARLKKLDWENLPTVRKPLEPEFEPLNWWERERYDWLTSGDEGEQQTGPCEYCRTRAELNVYVDSDGYENLYCVDCIEFWQYEDGLADERNETCNV